MSGATATIFVALAAYREPELGDTIVSCLERARHPERLVFGVCQQYDDALPGAGFGALDELRDETVIRLVRYPHTSSRGGCWARHRVQGLYNGEDYTLQCDAHSRLAENWDVDLIAAVESSASDKPLFTGFPPFYEVEAGEDVIPGDPADPWPVTLCTEWFPEGWIQHPTVPVRELGAAAASSLPDGARPTRMISGAFVFTLGTWNEDVRQDPESLYAGEEFALTLRSFTSGYDLWNPPRQVIWHRLHPDTNPKYIYDDPDGRQARRHLRAMQRLRCLLRGDPDRILGRYTLGTVRTLDDYRRFSGLDCATRTIDRDALDGVTPTIPAGEFTAARP